MVSTDEASKALAKSCGFGDVGSSQAEQQKNGAKVTVAHYRIT